MPIIIHFDISNLLENFIVNCCFILLIFILLKKKSVAKKKYEDLLLSIFTGKHNNEFNDIFNFTAREKEIIFYLVKGNTYNIYAKTGVNQKYDLLEKLNLNSLG